MLTPGTGSPFQQTKRVSPSFSAAQTHMVLPMFLCARLLMGSEIIGPHPRRWGEMAGWYGRNAKTQSPWWENCPVQTHVLFKSEVIQVNRNSRRVIHSVSALALQGRPLPPTVGPPGLIPDHPSCPQELGLGWSGNRHRFLKVLTSILKYHFC